MSARRPLVAVGFRIGIFLGDAVLLTQLIGICALTIWWLDAQKDWAGFGVIGGAAAGLAAYFLFVLFGLLSLWRQPFVFWQTLHPLNLTLAMLATTLNSTFFKKQPSVIALFALFIAGWFIGTLLKQRLPHHPRLWIILCFILLASRKAIPWEYAEIWSSGLAGFIFYIWWWRFFRGSRWNFFTKTVRQAQS